MRVVKIKIGHQDVKGKEICLGDKLKLLGDNQSVGEVVVMANDYVVVEPNDDWYYFHELESDGVLQVEVIDESFTA